MAPYKQGQRHPRHPGDAELRRLYVESGLSSDAVGARLGVAGSTALRWLRAAGLGRSKRDALRLVNGQRIPRHAPSTHPGDSPDRGEPE